MRVLVVGATGYIGKFVTRELVKRGYQTVALARERSGVKGKSSPEDTRRVRVLAVAACEARNGVVTATPRGPVAAMHGRGHWHRCRADVGRRACQRSAASMAPMLLRSTLQLWRAGRHTLRPTQCHLQALW